MIAAVNAWLRDHAHRHGATFIDYHAVLATESGALRDAYGTDGLHLSPAGYAAIEPLMLSALGRIPRPKPAPAASPRWNARRSLTGIVVAVAVLAAIAAVTLSSR